MDILIASSQKHASYASIMQVFKKKQILNKTNKKPIIYLANKTLLLYF